VGKTKRGKGSKIMAIADRQGRPVAVHVESATPHEVTLVHATLAERFTHDHAAHCSTRSGEISYHRLSRELYPDFLLVLALRRS
jgi:hypothetical protein